MKLNSLARSALATPKRSYFFAEPKPDLVSKNPGVTARRIIGCVGDRLRNIDPLRWNSVPITFKTHFRDGFGNADIRTIMHVHDALEREFKIEIKDRHTLITDIETAFYVIGQHHDAY